MLGKKGQGTLEYALIIAVVIAALIAMQQYLQGGVGGRLKASVDDIGEQFHADGYYRVSTTYYPDADSHKDVTVQTFGYKFNPDVASGNMYDTDTKDNGVQAYQVKDTLKTQTVTVDKVTSTWADEGTIF